jgi:hypothetical protein
LTIWKNDSFQVRKNHRLIRDIKGPLSKCCGGAPLKAQVFSSYLWNVHSKPFGSGFFGTVLERALNIFAATHHIYSPLFQKYVARIASEWGMPFTTSEEQQRIFDRVSDLASLSTRGEQSKLGRWFSWNQAAYQKLDDFSAWKMIFESYVAIADGIADPDDDTVPFDDLGAAARAKTPQAQILKLREAGGGIRLAYNMMKLGVRDWCRVIQVVTKPLWDWYTHQTTECQSPHTALQYAVAMSNTWISASLGSL